MLLQSAAQPSSVWKLPATVYTAPAASFVTRCVDGSYQNVTGRSGSVTV